MPDFRKVEHALVTPTSCVFCGGTRGPFIESVPEKEIPGFGRVYICATNEQNIAGCLVQAARLVGMLDVRQAAELERIIKTQREQIVSLQDQVDARDEPVIIGRNELAELRHNSNAFRDRFPTEAR